MNRHNKFPKIPKLDNELDLIVRDTEFLTGKFVKTFPPIDQVPENSRFFKEASPGAYREYIKLNGEYRLLGGGSGGSTNWIYVAWADDSSGTGFTLTFNASKNYIAFLTSATEITSPSAGDFAGLWKNYKGADGAAGADGADGQGIDHIEFTSSTGGGGAGVAGETDTYTIWGDAGETINMGTFDVYNGADGAPGTPGADGQGVPAGGTTGQILAKASNTDYDTEWITATIGTIIMLSSIGIAGMGFPAINITGAIIIPL